MRLLLIILTLSIFACSPQKRLLRLVKNHPELVKSDTIYNTIHDTIIGVQHDTIIQSGITRDTITIIDKQLSVKYFNNGKTVYIKGECDTIFKQIKVAQYINTVSPIKEIEKPLKWWQIVLMVMGVLSVLFIILDRWASRK